jgi:predicted outer membrane protein
MRAHGDLVMRKGSFAAVSTMVLLVATATTALAADRASEKFIKEAIEGNLAEVQVGRLAQEKGQRADEVVWADAGERPWRC